MLQKILAISGKPGLYKLVSRGKNSLIVETLDESRRRLPAFATDRITSLADIAMFTDSEDVPLRSVLAKIKEMEGGKATSIDQRKASGEELREYFGKVLPDFDRDRVHNSDIKKLLQWYNILISNGVTDFDEEAKDSESATAEPKEGKETEA